jgi:hypothetical protein
LRMSWYFSKRSMLWFCDTPLSAWFVKHVPAWETGRGSAAEHQHQRTTNRAFGSRDALRYVEDNATFSSIQCCILQCDLQGTQGEDLALNIYKNIPSHRQDHGQLLPLA